MREPDGLSRARGRYALAGAASLLVLGGVTWLWWYVGSLPSKCGHLQSAAAFAGSSVRFDDYVNSGRHPGAACTGVSVADARRVLYLNAAMGLLVAVLLFVLMALWLRRAVFTARALTWVWRMTFLSVAFGSLNIVQVVATYAGLYTVRSSPGGLGLRSWAARVLPILAWPKLVFFAVAALVLVVEIVSARGNVLGQFAVSEARPPASRRSRRLTRVWPLSKIWPFLSAHRHFLERPRQVEPVAEPEPLVDGLGICCSGGGIRAASVALGVLSSLEGHRKTGATIVASDQFDGKASLLDRAKFLASVSGGGYTAGSWRIAHGTEPTQADFGDQWPSGVIGDPWQEIEPPPETYDSDAPKPPPTLYRHIRARHEYLRTGRGGLAWSAIRALGYLVLQIVLLGAIVMFVAWPAGRLSRTWYVYGGIGCRTTHTATTVLPPAHGDLGGPICGTANTKPICAAPHVDPYLQHSLERARCFLGQPGVQMPITWSLVAAPAALAVLALGAFLPTLTEMRTRRRRAVRLTALALAGASVTLGLILIGVPLLLDVAYPYVTTPLGIGLLASAVTGSGIAATMLRFLRTQLSRRIDLLGKVLVLVTAVLFGIVVAGQAAIGHGVLALPAAGWLSGFAGCLALAVVVIVAFLTLDPRVWSLHVIYRDRLRNSFSTTREVGQARMSAILRSYRRNTAIRRLLPLSGAKEPTLNEYQQADGPTHLVCCSAARNTKAVSGVPALSFVFSPQEVVLYEPYYDGHEIGQRSYVAPTDAYMNALRSTRHQHATGTVSAAVAMSGAAVASAMGSFDAREPTSLFAFLNLRLGVWMPNPAIVGLGAPAVFKTRLSYLLKEIVGYFEPDDRHLYITDGGHRENLGLVELLRRRCKTIICIDASGDDPRSFATLRKAAATAKMEVGATVDLTPLPDPPEPGTATPLKPVGYQILEVTYSGGGDATIVHLAAELYEQCPASLRAFGAEDTGFPHFSTGNQFLSDTQFVNLVKFGRSLGDEALDDKTVCNAILASL